MKIIVLIQKIVIIKIISRYISLEKYCGILMHRRIMPPVGLHALVQIWRVGSSAAVCEINSFYVLVFYNNISE